MSRWRSEEGAVALEAAIVMSAALVGFFSLMVFAGRVLQMESEVAAAVQAAARAASLENNSSASAAAEATLTVNMDFLGGACEPPVIVPDPPAPPLASGALVERWVEVTLTCEVKPIGGLGPSVSITRNAVERIDAYRGDQ